MIKLTHGKGRGFCDDTTQALLNQPWLGRPEYGQNEKE